MCAWSVNFDVEKLFHSIYNGWEKLSRAVSVRDRAIQHLIRIRVRRIYT